MRKNQESRVKNQELGTKNQEPGTVNFDSGTMNFEPGTLNQTELSMVLGAGFWVLVAGKRRIKG